MLVAAWFAGSFIFFVLYFSQIKNLPKPLKAVFRSIDAYRMDILQTALRFICCDFNMDSTGVLRPLFRHLEQDLSCLLSSLAESLKRR